MSGAIRVAKGYYRGDPGILGSIWSGIKGAATGFLTGGPAGAILGGAAGVAGSISKPSGGAMPTQQAGVIAGNGKPLNPSINIASAFPTRGATPPMLPQNQTQIGLVNFGGPGRGNTTQGGTRGTDWDPGQVMGPACLRGHHPNKSGYYRKGGPRSNFTAGWVEKNTVCVKNRRRNPLNPRAASRAMARLASAKKAARFLGSFSIKSGCGCNGKRG